MCFAKLAAVDAVRRFLDERRLSLAILLGALGAGLALRLWLAFADAGVYWPDEIQQALEPAHRLVFGYGLLPWEFLLGGRTWVLPGLVAVLMKIATLVGLSEPGGYVPFIRVAFVGLSALTVWATYLLARAMGAGRVASAIGGAAFALSAPAIYFSPRPLSESATALPVVLAWVLFVRRPGRRWDVAVGISLLFLATLIRFQNGLFLLTWLGALALRRDWARLRLSGITTAGWVVAYGLFDHLTWGGWFHSFVVYVTWGGWIVSIFPSLADSIPRVVLGLDDFGWWYYPAVFFSSMGLASVLIGALAVAAAARRDFGTRTVLVTTALFIFAPSLLKHKEFRFVFIAIPLACALAAVGLEVVRERRWTAAYTGAAVAVVLASAWSGATFHRLTFNDIGQNGKFFAGTTQESAYDFYGPVNRMLLAAGRQPDLCGIKVEAIQSPYGLPWYGDYTYLNRRVPFYDVEGPRQSTGLYNYVVGFGDRWRVPTSSPPMGMLSWPGYRRDAPRTPGSSATRRYR